MTPETIEVPPIITACLGDDSALSSPSVPFTIGEYMYATDTSIAARVPMKPEYANLTMSKSWTGANELPWSADLYKSEPLPLASGFLKETPACKTCAVRGPVKTDTPETCEMCNGTGKNDRMQAALWCAAPTESVDAYGIVERYVRIIESHGGRIYARKGGKWDKAFRFAGDGFEGLVMPMRVRVGGVFVVVGE